MSLRDPGLRPAEPLPPTLVPNAVLLEAPRPDRMLSLLASGILYALLGLALAVGARGGARAGSAIVTHGYDWVLPHDDDGRIPLPPVARTTPPPDSGVRPAGFKAVEPLRDSNVVPGAAPDHLSTEDHSLEARPVPEANGSIAVFAWRACPGCIGTWEGMEEAMAEVPKNG